MHRAAPPDSRQRLSRPVSAIGANIDEDASGNEIFVEDALKRYSALTGHVEINNVRATRWLVWLGAKFGEPIEGYLPFVIRRQ